MRRRVQAVSADGKAPPPAPHQRLRLAGHASFSGKALPGRGGAADGSSAGNVSNDFSGDARPVLVRCFRMLTGRSECFIDALLE